MPFARRTDPRESARRLPRLNRGFALLWLGAVLVPALGVAGAGLASWHAVQAEAERRIERTVELLQQNALRAFGTQEVMLAALARAVAGRSAEALRQDAGLHALLADLSASGAPTVSGAVVTDGEGRILSASYEFPAREADLSDRDYIRALTAGGAPRAVGAPVASRPMGWPVIPVARRAMQAGPDDASPAIIVSSFNPEAISTFYASVAENPRDIVALLREDGVVLARHPPVTPEVALEGKPRFVAQLADLLSHPGRAGWAPAALDGAPRLFVGQRVGDWPVAVSYGLDRSALRAAWRQRMLSPLAGGVAATVLLMALTWTAQRSARRQREQAESRVEAEAQLARAGRAQAIGLLAGGVAHDVKNLVQSVRSGARVLQRRAEDAEEVRRVATLMADAAARGGRLADAMIGFARGGSAGAEGPLPVFDPAQAMAEVADLLARTLGSGWPVRSVVRAGLPAAHGDRAGFEAAVVNLAANARDAMPGGGVVTLAAWMEELAEPLEEAGLRAGRYVVAAVTDGGEGMDAETLARIGEPFFTTKAATGGTGLGLATVRGFCAGAGGALRVESSPGQGTTAAIWLPAA